MEKKTTISKDAANKKMVVLRDFDAPLAQVWNAWTDPEILDQWWAPEPWKARTKTMNFKPGGYWLYAMVGPDGSEHWSKADYISIVVQDNFIGEDYFCDSDGNKIVDFPSMHWENSFSSKKQTTQLKVEITFTKE